MSRSLFALAALLSACAALAAPAPEPFAVGWDKPVDPDRDCKIRRDIGVLTIEMPGTAHDYDALRKQFNAPRLLRESKEYFDLQVRLQIDCRLSAQSTVKGQPSTVSAGFLLIYPNTDRKISVRCDYGVSREGAEQYDYTSVKDWFYRRQRFDKTWDRGLLGQFHAIRTPGWEGWPLRTKGEHTYLRLEQPGERIYFYLSPDGEKWTLLDHEPRLPAKSKVGLAAFTTSSEPSRVQFDQLKFSRVRRSEPQR